MKNKDDYFSENPGDSKAVDKSTQFLKPKLGDEANYGTDEADYAVEDDDHYAG